MIPFVLGFIGGFAFAVLVFVIWAVVRASGMRSREEEEFEAIRCTMQGLQGEGNGMPSALSEVHKLEETAVRNERICEARERVN